MKNLFKVTLGMSIALIGVSASAATYYKNEGQCQAMYAAGETAPYAPSARHVAYSNESRIAGMEIVGLETDACVYMATAAGNQWVFLSQGTKVYVKGAQVFFLAECRNTIMKIVSLKARTVAERPPSAEPAQQLPGTTSVTPAQFAALTQTPVAINGYPADGTVYSDPSGNTFQREQIGSRVCNYFVNGRLAKTIAAPPGLSEAASKQYCDLEGEVFKATLRPTTPETGTPKAPAPSSHNIDISVDEKKVAQVTSPQTQQSAGAGNVTCNFRQDNKIVKTEKFNTDAECKAWTLKEAKERGLNPA